MHASVRRHLHPCPRGRVAIVRRGTPILALLLMSLGPSLGPWSARALARAKPAAQPHPQPRKAPAAKPPKPPTPPLPCSNTNLQPAPTDLAAIDAATLCLVNQVRAAGHLRPLRFSTPLQGVAAGQTQDMVAGRLLRRHEPHRPDADAADPRYPLSRPRGAREGRAKHWLGDRPTRDTGGDGASLDAVAAAPRNHSHRQPSATSAWA